MVSDRIPLRPPIQRGLVAGVHGFDRGVGEEAEVRAAWLPFPQLTFEPLPQVYRREAERTYRYESDGGRFVRTLEVDSTGFVTSYPGLWQAEV